MIGMILRSLNYAIGDLTFAFGQRQRAGLGECGLSADLLP